MFFQGGNSISPYILRLFLPLSKHFRLYAPGTIGHPGRSAQTRISPRDNSYGKWAADLDMVVDFALPLVLYRVTSNRAWLQKVASKIDPTLDDDLFEQYVTGDCLAPS